MNGFKFFEKNVILGPNLKGLSPSTTLLDCTKYVIKKMFFCQRKNEIVKIIFLGVNWSQMESTMDTDLKQVDGKNWRLHLLYNGEMISELRITE